MTEKLKSFLKNDRHFLGLLLIMSVLASFFLGRASVLPPPEEARNSITITPAKRAVDMSTSQLEPLDVSPTSHTSGPFVASRSGTKYHRTDCPGASQIKPENQVYFVTAAAAAAAGYTPAANCPGLE